MDGVTPPVVKDLVLAGGGHAHVAVLRSFGMKPLDSVRLTLISREPHAPYSGMLPGLVAGHYTFDEAHIDLGPLARFASARFLRDEVVGLDLENKRVLCAGRPPVAFDVLSLNTGSAPSLPSGADVDEPAEGLVPVKPIDQFYERWQRLRTRAANGSGPLAVGIVGGGAGGVELALAIRHGLAAAAADASRETHRLELFTDSDDILPAYDRRVRGKFRRILSERGIGVHTGRRAVGAENGRLLFAHGEPEDLDEVLWVTTAAAPDWPRTSGLAVDDGGFVRVTDTLQSVTHPDVFAAGDLASMESHPRPKSGVFAVRQGPVLTDNLRRRLRGERLVRYRPQRRFLSLVSTGPRHAVASRNGIALEGRWVWRWKDWIDRRFMRKYNDLPAMDGTEPAALTPLTSGGEPSLAPPAMRCGGCGSKVGSDLLERALARVRGRGGPDVLLGLDAPDDAAVVRVPEGMVAVQSVDHFRSFVEDPYVFGQVAANHALGDVFAMGAEPRHAMALVTVALAAEDKMVEDLAQLMAGAVAVLDRDGTALVGGHTSEGPEMALGFSVTGVAAPDDVLRKSGVRPGDALILTRPLGTGALFAAEMRGEARSRWVDEALRQMVVSHAPAARIFREHGAGAMTDVTGFGLVGHLLEMARASGVDVEVDLDAVPLLDGAREVAGRGFLSSLQPQNLRLRRAVRGSGGLTEDPRFQLLFDPQTAGGLLASVAADRADACLEALRASPYPAASVVARAAPLTDPAQPLVVRSHGER